jgi:hypothetical protein
MTIRTGSRSVEWQRRQAVEDGALVARDLAKEHERVALLTEQSGDEVLQGWTLSLGLVQEQADQGAQQLQAFACLLADDGEIGLRAVVNSGRWCGRLSPVSHVLSPS